MPTVADLLTAVESVAPPHRALPDDPIGLQVGRKSDPVSRCMIALDATPEAVQEAAEAGAQAVISHHALIYEPIRSLAGDSMQAQALRLLVRNETALIVAHTNWDAAPGGVSDTLAESLSLLNVAPFGGDVPSRAYKLVTFLPESALDAVLDALAAAGCGTIGLYRRCAFFNAGYGTYEPQPGANPLVGDVGGRETTEERRLEVLVPGNLKEEAVAALRRAHPYDEPAFDLYQLAAEPSSLPRCGDLPVENPFGEMQAYVERALNCRARSFGNPEVRVRRVGVVGGSGGGYWLSAKLAGCDALVTGEVRHHEAVEAVGSGMCLIEAGHYHTEQPGMQALSRRMSEALPEVEFRLFEPPPGAGGRPV